MNSVCAEIRRAAEQLRADISRSYRKINTEIRVKQTP